MVFTNSAFLASVVHLNWVVGVVRVQKIWDKLTWAKIDTNFALFTKFPINYYLWHFSYPISKAFRLSSTVFLGKTLAITSLTTFFDTKFVNAIR